MTLSVNGDLGTCASHDFFGTSVASLGDLDEHGVGDLAGGAQLAIAALCEARASWKAAHRRLREAGDDLALVPASPGRDCSVSIRIPRST